MTQVSIVVPCFNEAARLRPEAFLAAVHAQPGLSFVMVDDGSRDETRAVLQALAEASNGAIRCLPLDKNVGKAEAVRQGVQHVLDAGPDAFGFFDADLSTPLDEIPAFRQILDTRPQIEVVMGSRVKLLGREIERRALRHYAGRVFATCASTTLGVPVYDTQCGAKLFRNSRGTRWAFRTPFLSRWLFDVEILARLALLGRDHERYAPLACVYEHPLAVWRDIAGSKIRPGDWLRAAFDLARIGMRYRCRRRSRTTP